MGRRRIAGMVAAVAAVLAVDAGAFEYAYWGGSVRCTVTAKVQGEMRRRIAEEYADVDLVNETGLFSLGPIEGASFLGTALMEDRTHYDAAVPYLEEDLIAFASWVHDMVLAQAGNDVDLIPQMYGTFVFRRDFTRVRVRLKIIWFGTVSGGEHDGKPAGGVIRIRGALPPL